MKSFEHVNATSIDEAIKTLEYGKGKAVLIAGGTDLLGITKDRILPDHPEIVINIKTIRDLDYIRKEPAGLKIGALAKLSDIAESAGLLANYGGLVQAARSIATPEIRNMGTIGGNLCQQVRCWYYRYPHQLGGRIMCRRKGGSSCPAVKGDNRYHSIMGGKGCVAVCPSDMAVMLTALDAKLTIAGPEGKRTLPVGDFFTAMGTTLNRDEILTEIQIPKQPAQSRQTYLKYSLRQPIDFAVVSVASVITRDQDICLDAAIALGGVAPTPIRASAVEKTIKGRVADAAIAETASEAAVKSAKPLGMNGYKVDITKTLVMRAILSEESQIQ
jgi:xanthine dehydrogenase YagS FAD-binding subunit